MNPTDDFYKAYALIKRPGADNLLNWLEKSDFFTAPASTRFHGNFVGGLVVHSVNVYNRLACDDEEKRAVCGLLHDLCKVGFYTIEMRNVKKNGLWEKVPFYTVKDQFPYGHGEKSVYIINKFMKLTDEEAFAIRWHMGGFDDSVKGGSYCLNGAFEKYPLALQLNIADTQATYIDEVKKEED